MRPQSERYTDGLGSGTSDQSAGDGGGAGDVPPTYRPTEPDEGAGGGDGDVPPTYRPTEPEAEVPPTYRPTDPAAADGPPTQSPTAGEVETPPPTEPAAWAAPANPYVAAFDTDEYREFVRRQVRFLKICRLGK